MNSCIVCSGTRFGPLYAGILRCENCGYAVADLSLNNDDLSEIYRKNYFFGGEYKDYVADRNVIQKNFRLRLKVLEKYLDVARHRRLLEIGCAYGFFLDTVRDRFESVRGVDISEDGVRYARDTLRLNASLGDFMGLDLREGEIDVACMWDTIEHVLHPDSYLEKLSAHMKAGALLTITTGDAGSVNARLKGSNWRLIHPPTHVHYFSMKNMAAFLDKYGFEVVHSRYCGFYRSIDLVAYNILVLRNRGKWLYEMLKRSGLTGYDFYFNMYDIMYVIGRKR
jgi:SAM-dependent methyltransferase